MKQWNSFQHYAGYYGGVADIAALQADGSPAKWLGDILVGLKQISDSYHGDKNKRGARYQSSSGVFENMDFNGGASRSQKEYLFGVTLGVPLRLMSTCLLLAGNTLDADDQAVLSFVIEGKDEDSEPHVFEKVMGRIQDPAQIALSQSMTFFSLGFIWMHEAFHTLIGHVDFASEVLGLSIDELNMEDPGGLDSTVLQALELDADGAALTNLCLTLVKTPGFGYCADGNLDPAHRVAQAAEGAVIALGMLEIRRAIQKAKQENSHPNPSRRFANLLGMLRTFERRQMLPMNTVSMLSQRIARIQPAFSGTSLEPLLDYVIGNAPIQKEDSVRLSDLIKLGRAELSVFDETSFAPRVIVTDR